MATYNGNNPADLNVLTPVENATPPSELNDSDREIKRVIKNQFTVVAKTGDYTALSTDSIITVDASGAPATITLPAVASVSSATTTKKYVIKKVDSSANAVTITGSENIDGSSTLVLTKQYDSIELFGNGSTWNKSVAKTLSNADVGLGSVTNDSQVKRSEMAAASGVATLDTNSLVVQNPANATATPTAGKIPIADGNGSLGSWTALTSAYTALVSSSSLTDTNYHEVLTLDLAAGTWLIIARVVTDYAGTLNASFAALLSTVDPPAVATALALAHSHINTTYTKWQTISISCIVTPTTTTTYKLSCACGVGDANNHLVVLGQAPADCTNITAIRIA